LLDTLVFRVFSKMRSN